MGRKPASNGAKAAHSRASTERRARAAERERDAHSRDLRPDVETASAVRIVTIAAEGVDTVDGVIAADVVDTVDDVETPGVVETPVVVDTPVVVETLGIVGTPEVVQTLDVMADSDVADAEADVGHAFEVESSAPLTHDDLAFDQVVIADAHLSVVDAPMSAPIQGMTGRGVDDAIDLASADGAFDATPPHAVAHEHAAELAREILAACDDCDRGLAIAVQARQDQEMAWLMLCDRGWPADSMVPVAAIPEAEDWLACWREFVALPVKVEGIRDRFRLRGMQQRFEKAELAMRPLLPATLWQLVLPLDATGRATLSFLLQGVQALEEARARSLASQRHRAQLIARFNAFRNRATAIGAEPPDAPLDTASWRRVANAALRR
jgi:hypothetical protein